MKITTEKNPGISINTESAEFMMANNSSLYDVLCDRIYSDKPRCVINELLINAIDSHTEAGQTKRVELKLPSTIDPKFIIQDYGLGLDKEQAMGLYVTYGLSTKTESDDLTGALGIGSKIFWSVSEMTEIRTVKNGLEHIFICTRNNKNHQQINCMSGEGIATNKPNGVRIEFTVKDKINDYAGKLQKVIENFPEKLIPINMETGKPFERDEKEWDFENSDYKYKHGGSYAYTNQSYAVMGNVTYKLDISYIKNRQNLFGWDFDLVLFFDMGEVAFQAGREVLDYTTITIDNINKKCQKVHDDICKKLEQQFKSCKTNFEFIVASNAAAHLSHFSNNVKFKNFDKAGIIDEAAEIAKEDSLLRTVSRSSYGRTSNYTLDTTNSWNTPSSRVQDALKRIVSADKIKVLFKDSTNYLQKINFNYDVGFNSIIVFEDEDVCKRFCNHLGIEYDITSKLLEPPKNYNGGTQAKLSKVFKFDSKARAKMSSSRHSRYWEEDDVDFNNDSGFYVEINSYHVMDGKRQIEPVNFVKLIDVYNKISNSTFNKDIYGIKTQSIKSLKKSKGKWINAYEFIFNEMKDALEKNKEFYHYKLFDTMRSSIVYSYKKYNDGDNYVDLQNFAKFDSTHIIANIAETYKVEKKLAEDFYTKYKDVIYKLEEMFVQHFYKEYENKKVEHLDLIREAKAKYVGLSQLDNDITTATKIIRKLDRLELLEDIVKNNKIKV